MSATTELLREFDEEMAVTRRLIERGVNYLGICPGGLLAGKAECNSLNLTSGVKFGFYAVVNRGVHKAAVPIACAEAPARVLSSAAQ